VQQSPFLKARIDARVSNLSSEKLNAKFEPLSSEHSTMDGLNIHAVIIDELHAHKDRKLVDVLDTATGSRMQPILVEITTAGEYDPASICWKHHEYSLQVLEHGFEDSAAERWFAYVATTDEGDDWKSPATWIKANPNIGVSKSIETVRMECERAQQMPSDENKFRRYHLNQWVKQAERWINLDVWSECRKPFAPEELAQKPCYAGLDLAASSDMAALVLLFPFDGMKVIPKFWIPEDRVRKLSGREADRYVPWIDAGYLETTPGETLDYNAIRHQLREYDERFEIREVGVDPWNATHLANQLEDEDGFAARTHNGESRVVFIRQGMANMSGPTKELERLIMARDLEHDGHPVMTWMFDNVAIRRDPEGNIRIDRDKSREKVDGMVALVMALACYIKQRTVTGSVYADRGILAVDWFE